MAMHLERAFITTTRYSAKGKKTSNTSSLRAAKEKHEKWLISQGLSSDKLVKSTKSITAFPDYKTKENAKLSNNIAVKGGFKNGVLDNLHKESPEVQKAILEKAKRTAPAYSKGAYQYITDGANLSDLGKKK